MLILGCQKDKTANQFPESRDFSVTSRDEFTVTLTWLKDFQSDFVVALDTGFLLQPYTIDEIVAGVEALINIATSTPEIRTVHQTEITYFQVNTSNDDQAIRDVYYTSYNAYRNQWLSSDTTETYPVVVDVRIDSVNGNTAYIKSTSIIGVNNSTLDATHTYTGGDGCEPFGEYDGYRVGGGDEEFSLQDFYWNLACDNACGSTPPNEPGPTTAYEAIEERLNFNYTANNPPSCPLNYVFRGWVNVKKLDAYPLDFLKDDCPFVENQQIKTCMEDTELNCVYCSIYDQIGEEPFEISSGKQFISLNLGLSVCACGGSNQCAYLATLRAEYFIGTPVCKLATTPPTRWMAPKSFDLEDVTF